MQTNFKKQYRYDKPYWFSGIYKIVQYDLVSRVPYYQCYYIPDGGVNWGEFVSRSVQRSSPQGKDRLTLEQCVALCDEHLNSGYKPTPKTLKRAEEVRKAWQNDLDQWGNPTKRVA